jgi:hypothetical protein
MHQVRMTISQLVAHLSLVPIHAETESCQLATQRHIRVI